jgi:hypothetical protein
VNNRTPEAEGLEVVVVGSFNPAIFHPEWFLRQDLIGDQDAKDAATKVVSRNVTDVELCGIRLVCIPERVVLSTSNISQAPRIQDLLVRILMLLPHTPVSACGINPWAHYRVSSTDYWHKIGHTLAPKDLIWKDLFKSPGMLSLTIQEPRAGEFPGQINVTVEPSLTFAPGILVKSNYHYGLPADSLHTGAAEALPKFLRAEWNVACEIARRVANTLLEKIKPDHE